MGKKWFYLAVTRDKYELPLAVSDDPKELARMLGISENGVYKSIRRGSGIIKISQEEEDEEDGKDRSQK